MISSTSFTVVAIFWVDDSITTPPLYESLEKYPPPANLTPLQLNTREYAHMAI